LFPFCELLVLDLNVYGKEPDDLKAKDALKSKYQYVVDLRDTQLHPGDSVTTDVHTLQLQLDGKIVLRPIAL
jgi:hypothetical protein